MSGSLEHLTMILWCQMRREQTDRRKRDRTVGQSVEDHREPPRDTSRLDAVVGGVLREVQHLGAIDEQRRAALSKIQTTDIELGERGDELHRGVTLVDGKPCDLSEQVGVRQR